jgi:hypothetical protein
MASQESSNTVDADAQVPEDFPARKPSTSVSGGQTKLALIEYDGRYHVSGNSPPELRQRYAYCRGLADWFADKCLRNEHGKYRGLTRTEIIGQYHARLQAMRSIQFDDVSKEEATWVMRRCAEKLGWPFPDIDD